jgi:hypothetical protein
MKLTEKMENALVALAEERSDSADGLGVSLATLQALASRGFAVSFGNGHFFSPRNGSWKATRNGKMKAMEIQERREIKAAKSEVQP